MTATTQERVQGDAASAAENQPLQTHLRIDGPPHDYKGYRLEGIGAKLAWVVARMERIPKNGWNNQQGYKFALESDIVDFVRPFLEVQNLAITWTTERCEIGQVMSANNKPMTSALVEIRAFLWNGDNKNGEPVDLGKFPGFCVDSGDKAVTKALTSAKKYAYLLTFHLSTGDDVENPRAEERGGQQRGGQQRGGQQQQHQRPPQAEKPRQDPNGPITEAQKTTISALTQRGQLAGHWTEERTAMGCRAVSKERGEGKAVSTVDELHFAEAGEFIGRIQKALEAAKKDASSKKTNDTADAAPKENAS